jgi:hypothetical protein
MTLSGDCVALLRAKNAGFALFSFWNEERNHCGVTPKKNLAAILHRSYW